MNILIINGPNMNMLGIHAELFQSNHEGAIVDKIQSAYGVFDGIIINAAAYTHTSIAIPDALRAVGIPAAEVHISDPDAREDFRRVNFLRPVCVASVAGCGGKSPRRHQKVWRSASLSAERWRRERAKSKI